MKKNTLILGGSSDIGVELVKMMFRKNKYILNVHYNSNIKSLKNLSSNINLIQANFTNVNIDKLLSKFKKNYDIIINLTGYIDNQSFEKFNLNNFEKTIRANSIIPMIIIRESIKNMVKKKWGRIINSSSIGVKFGGGDKTFNYSASKHFNEFIPKSIRELSDKNILYNVIKIGLVNTKIHKKISNKDLKKRIKMVPMQKIADPIDIAKYICDLISEENKFITGEVLSISGGE